jgi:hypothetical protein
MTTKIERPETGPTGLLAIPKLLTDFIGMGRPLMPPKAHRCRRCDRKLKNKDSIAAGIGHVCSRKEAGDSGQVTKPKARKGKVETDPRQLAFDLRVPDEVCQTKEPRTDVKKLFEPYIHGGAK